MFRKWAMLTITAGLVILAGSAASRAGDDEDESPLAKIMKKIDVDTKAIREAISSSKKFEASDKGKKVAPAAKEIVKLAKETRTFKEPSVKQKKPYEKWTLFSDLFLKAAEDTVKAVEKGNLNASKKAWKALDQSCSNCHGAFRPEVGSDF